MWLSILIVVGIVGGIALALAGIGPLAFPLIGLGIIAFAVKVFGGAAAQDGGGAAPSGQGPEDTVNAPRTHAETGYAHRGQEHMTG